MILMIPAPCTESPCVTTSQDLHGSVERCGTQRQAYDTYTVTVAAAAGKRHISGRGNVKQ